MHLKQEFWKVWLVDCCILVARGYVVPRSCGGDFLECKVLHFEPVTCALGMGLGPPASRSTGVATCFWHGQGWEGQAGTLCSVICLRVHGWWVSGLDISQCLVSAGWAGRWQRVSYGKAGLRSTEPEPSLEMESCLIIGLV